MKHSRATLTIASASLAALAGCSPLQPTEPNHLVPESSEEMIRAVKESPLMITVTIDKDYKVFVNKESAGTTEDVAPLKEKLSRAMERRNQYIRERAKAGSPVENEESVKRMAFLRAPATFKYSDASKVVEAIKSVGGEPIVLQGGPPAEK